MTEKYDCSMLTNEIYSRATAKLEESKKLEHIQRIEDILRIPHQNLKTPQSYTNINTLMSAKCAPQIHRTTINKSIQNEVRETQNVDVAKETENIIENKIHATLKARQDSVFLETNYNFQNLGKEKEKDITYQVKNPKPILEKPKVEPVASHPPPAAQPAKTSKPQQQGLGASKTQAKPTSQTSFAAKPAEASKLPVAVPWPDPKTFTKPQTAGIQKQEHVQNQEQQIDYFFNYDTTDYDNSAQAKSKGFGISSQSKPSFGAKPASGSSSAFGAKPASAPSSGFGAKPASGFGSKANAFGKK